jgi:hypothetical protein
MTMEGGGPPSDWAALAPHIAHPTREAIAEQAYFRASPA